MTDAPPNFTAHVGLARSLARGFYFPGGDRDDVMQEALIGLLKACRDFRPDAGASFSTFARLVITRHLSTCVRFSTRGKHEILSSAVREIRSPETADGLGESVLGIEHIAVDERSPERIVFAADRLRELVDVVDHRLSPVERRSFTGVFHGETYVDLAAEQGITIRAVDNAVQRASRKLKAAA